MLAEAIFFGKRASRKVVLAIIVVCLGVGLSTVTDTQVPSIFNLELMYLRYVSAYKKSFLPIDQGDHLVGNT